jgi:hypothetical protein
MVVKRRTAYPDSIFTQSVTQRSVNGDNYFLMTDHVAVKQAVYERATRLNETELENLFRVRWKKAMARNEV